MQEWGVTYSEILEYVRSARSIRQVRGVTYSEILEYVRAACSIRQVWGILRHYGDSERTKNNSIT
jgi:hypothetical protein